jgi:hypothetical protein
MENVNGGLKDIFSTILNQQSETAGKRRQLDQPIIVRGDGNVIALGGTVHVSHPPQPQRQRPRRRRPGGK